VPAGVESKIVEFVSSGDEGIEAVLALRQVCKTTKSWIDNLPSRIAARVFSKAFVSVRNDQVTEDYVAKLNQFTPLNGLTTLHLTLYFVPDTDQDSNQFKKFLDFWCGRLEKISLKMFTLDKITDQHIQIANILNTCLEKAANLRELHVHIRSLVDLYLLKEFILNRKKSSGGGGIHIHLKFGEPWSSSGGNWGLEFTEILRAILESIVENRSMYRIDIRDDGFPHIIRRVAAGSATHTPLYSNFLKTIKHLECKGIPVYDLQNKYLSLETLICGSLYQIEDLTIPDTVKHLRLQRCPLGGGTLPESLTSFHFDEYHCYNSRIDIIHLIRRLEDECPNLIVLYVRWTLACLKDPRAIIERTGPKGFSSKINS